MKILVIGPSWVGDMVMAQSLFILLRQLHPNAEIHVLAPAWSQALLAHMPEVAGSIEMTVGHGELQLGKRRAIARQVRAGGFDQAIVLPNSFKSALIPWFAGIPRRTGWRGEARSLLLNDCRILDPRLYPLMVERFAALALAPGGVLPAQLPRPALQVSAQTTMSALARLGLDTHSPALVLCPGAEFGAAKKWPASSYAAVSDHWLQQGGQVWILGSANDGKDAGAIMAGLPQHRRDHCRDLAGKTTLADAVAVMAAASAVISNDSGLMHVAAALARPLVVVYGSTSPAFTPPLADQVRSISLGLGCSPCFKRVCPLGHTDCLNKLAPGLVIDALRELALP